MATAAKASKSRASRPSAQPRTRSVSDKAAASNPGPRPICASWTDRACNSTGDLASAAATSSRLRSRNFCQWRSKAPSSNGGAASSAMRAALAVFGAAGSALWVLSESWSTLLTGASSAADAGPAFPDRGRAGPGRSGGPFSRDTADALPPTRRWKPGVTIIGYVCRMYASTDNLDTVTAAEPGNRKQQ